MQLMITNVYYQVLVIVGIVELSTVGHPYWTAVAHFRVVVFETFEKLVVVCHCRVRSSQLL